MSSKIPRRFPILKPSEIVEYVGSLVEGHRLTERDIVKPQQATVLPLYQYFADLFMNIQYGQFSNQPELDQQCAAYWREETEFSVLYEDSMAMMAFFQEMYRLMRMCGVDDFELRDLVRPEGPRLKVIFSAIINFAKFREECIPAFTKLCNEAEILDQRRADLVGKNDMLAQELQALRMKRAEEEPQVLQLRQEAMDLAAQLKDRKHKGDLANAELTKLKQAKADAQDLLHNYTLRLDQCKQECQRLQGRIVRNPEEIKKAIVDMQENLQVIKASVADLDRNAVDLDSKLENIASVEQDLLNNLKLLQECEQEYQRVEDAKKQSASLAASVERKELELRELTAKEQQLKRQMQHQEEKLQRFQQQIETKRQVLDSKLQKSRENWDTLGEERVHHSEEMQNQQRLAASTKQKIQEVKEEYEREAHGFQHTWNQLQDNTAQYMGNMRQAMASISTSLEAK